MERYAELLEVMHRLRTECAWNREQTHETLAPYLLEEAHELVEAIEAGDREELREELGDLLYHVMFHAAVASEHPEEPFGMEEIAARATEKMVGRHPHVFGDVVAETPEEVVKVWDAVKAEEKAARTSVLDGVPMSMPALALADKLIGRARQAGVELGSTSGEGADARGSAPSDEAALGRALLATVAEARKHGLDAERALRGALRELAAQVRSQEAAARE